jgi:hypothetical protein
MQTIQINQDYVASNGSTVTINGSMSINRDGTRSAALQWITPTRTLDINLHRGTVIVPGKGEGQVPADLLADLRGKQDTLRLSDADIADDTLWAEKEAKLARNMARAGF